MIATCFIAQPIRKRADELCKVMSELIGFDVLSPTRKREAVTARVMVAHQLRREGVMASDIGRLLGKDHSTIDFYSKKMEVLLTSPGYEAEREIWARFQTRV